MRRIIRGLGAVGAGTVACLADGVVNTNLVGIVDNATAGFNYVQAFVWVVVAFGVTLAIVKWAKRRG